MTAQNGLSRRLDALIGGFRQLGLRALLLTIAAVALFNIAFLIVFGLQGGRQTQTLLAPPIMSQAAAAANLMDALAPDQRGMAIDALNSPSLRVAVTQSFRATPAVRDPKPVFVPIISAYAAVLGDREFSVYLRDGETVGPLRRAVLSDRLIIVIRLNDGSGLVVEAGADFRRLVGVYSAAAVIGVVSLVLIGLMTWASLSYARPLSRLAAASEGFAQRVGAGEHVEPLPETGPKPVRDLATALNLMRARLSRLMAERMTTLAAIAHDMRTYLTRIRMRSEFIDDPEQREKAVRDLEDMARLLEDALSLGEAEARPPERAPLALGAFLEDFVSRRRDVAPDAEIALRLDIAPSIETDVVDLTRVLNNLFDNALRYAGSVEIAAVERPEGGVEIAVRDNGPGVPEDMLEALTKPFVRLEASRSRETGGAGLGLAIAVSRAARAGAELSLENRPEGGLAVRLRFPADRVLQG